MGNNSYKRRGIMVRFFWVFRYLLLFGGLLVCGCSTQTIKFYDGPRLPDRQVATLVFAFTVDLKIDGKDAVADPQEFALKRQIKLLPGSYEIEWEKGGWHYNFIYKGNGVLNAEAGQRYAVRYECELGAPRLVVIYGEEQMGNEVVDFSTWIENMKTKKVVVGRKLIRPGRKFATKFNIVFSSGHACWSNGDYEWPSTIIVRH